MLIETEMERGGGYQGRTIDGQIPSAVWMLVKKMNKK